MSANDDLSKILTPAFYDKILRIHFPWDGHVDVAFASKFYFGGVPDNRRQVYEAYHEHALKPLSRIFLATGSIPELRSYLPAPSDPKYAEHVLALILVLDQGPRALYTQGLDVRWGLMFFDIMSQKVFKGLVAEGALPDSIDTWLTLGYSFEDAMIRKFWIYAPLIHSEDPNDHKAVSGMIEQMRVDVEKYSGKVDPWRGTRDEDRNDTTLFRRLILEGPPETFPEFYFWLFRVFDAHRPISERYGRYPYNNTSMGRVSTEEERKYLEETKHFHEPDLTDEQVKALQEQVESGYWEPLSDLGPW